LESAQHLVQWHDLTADGDVDFWGRNAQIAYGPPDLLVHTTQIGPGNISRHGHHALHIVAFVLTNGGALLYAGEVAQENRFAITVTDWQVLGLFDGSEVRLRDLHLTLVGDPAVRIGPIVWNHKPAGGSGSDER